MINMISSPGKNKAYGVYEFVADDLEDLKKLPKYCHMGSTVLVISKKTIYVKNGAGKWINLSDEETDSNVSPDPNSLLLIDANGDQIILSNGDTFRVSI